MSTSDGRDTQRLADFREWRLFVSQPAEVTNELFPIAEGTWQHCWAQLGNHHADVDGELAGCGLTIFMVPRRK